MKTHHSLVAFAMVAGKIISGKALVDLRRRLKQRRVFSAHLTYQTCRFCKAGEYGSKGGGLYKYGVRHYICGPCMRDADPTLAPSPRERGRE